MRKLKTDIYVTNNLGLFSFTWNTIRGRKWMRDNLIVPKWQHPCETVYVDGYTYAYDIAQGALNDGLRIE